MSFTDALGYPFKGGNIPKILSIVLTLLVIVVGIVTVALMLQSGRPESTIGAAFLSIVPIILAYGLIVSGYLVSVIRSIMDGEEFLPSVQFGRDLGRGFMMVIAGIIYMLPLIIIFGCLFSMILGPTIAQVFESISSNLDNPYARNSYSSYSSSPDGSSALLICGAMIGAVIFGFISGNALVVGMIRFAAEERASALFDFGRNFSTVFSNLGSFIGLFIRQFAIGIIYGIITNIATGIFNTSLNSMSRDSLSSIPLLIGIFAGIYAISLSLQLMSQISSAHLMAGLGMELGIGGKRKHDDYSF